MLDADIRAPGGAGRPDREHLEARRRGARGAELRAGGGRRRPRRAHLRARAASWRRRARARAQLLDDARSRRDQARERARPRARAARRAPRREARQHRRRAAAARRAAASGATWPRPQLAELEVTHAKYDDPRARRADGRADPVHLAGRAGAAGNADRLGPRSARTSTCRSTCRCADLGRLRVGQRVEIELDSRPGRRVPGEISFIADQANFTPEKIETRSDRMGQVYRAKVRILEGRRALPARHRRQRLPRRATRRRDRRTRDPARGPGRDAERRLGERSRSACAACEALRRTAGARRHRPRRSTGRADRRHRRARRRRQDDAAARARRPARGRGRRGARPRLRPARRRHRAEGAASATCRRRSACTATCR